MARSGTRERGDPHPAAATDAGEQQDRAEALARQLHWGQKELDGQPYIGHIERVVALVQTDDEKTVAWLHDVLEDTPTTANDLVRAGFSDAIVEAVKLLSRDPLDSYADYIDTIHGMGNLVPLAKAVKVADLRDHLRPNCPERLRPRYERALEVLTAALPAHQERTEQEESAFRTLKSIAAMLGWENLPPRRILEAEISALKARARADNHHNALTCPYCNPDKLELAAPARAAEWQPTGVESIAAERERQIMKEGWTEAHDNGHDLGQLVTAAMCYALHASNQTRPKAKQDMSAVILSRWPWEPRFWKPSDDPRRNLVKAGALIAAEIDRLNRALPPPCALTGSTEIKETKDG